MHNNLNLLYSTISLVAMSPNTCGYASLDNKKNSYGSHFGGEGIYNRLVSLIEEFVVEEVMVEVRIVLQKISITVFVLETMMGIVHHQHTSMCLHVNTCISSRKRVYMIHSCMQSYEIGKRSTRRAILMYVYCYGVCVSTTIRMNIK